MRLNECQKEYIINEMNPEDSNHKDCNFFKYISKNLDGYTQIEVGYWITYLSCKPIYKRETRAFKLPNQ